MKSNFGPTVRRGIVAGLVALRWTLREPLGPLARPVFMNSGHELDHVVPGTRPHHRIPAGTRPVRRP
jgi:hypothetical protein